MFIAKVWRELKILLEVFFSSSIWFLLGCYQDKLHPHERNRKQLETKFNKQPGGGAHPATIAEAAPIAEPAGEEEE
jgi:hypothetical protein